MGRELKRVPLYFNWPLKKVWGGYVNPYSSQSTECPACDGSGNGPEAARYYDEWYGKSPFDPIRYGSRPLTIDNPALQAFARRQCEREPGYYGTGEHAVRREAARLFGLWRHCWCHQLSQADVDALLAAGRLMDFTRVPRTPEQREVVKAKLAAGGNSWLPEDNGYHPTADEVNDWSLGGIGHGSINAYACVKARCAREGITDIACRRCRGDGRLWPSEEIEAAHEAWKPTEPPTGEGFQLWETTSEGSPVSPVFASIEPLCEWAAANATTFGNFRATAEQWRQMLDVGFVRHEEGNAVFF